MQWKMRPGPSRSCAIMNAWPRGPSRLPAGTRTSVEAISQWAPEVSPIVGTSRTIS